VSCPVCGDVPGARYLLVALGLSFATPECKKPTEWQALGFLEAPMPPNGFMPQKSRLGKRIKHIGSQQTVSY